MCFFNSALILKDDGHWAHWNGLQEKEKFYVQGSCLWFLSRLLAIRRGIRNKLCSCRLHCWSFLLECYHKHNMFHSRVFNYWIATPNIFKCQLRKNINQFRSDHCLQCQGFYFTELCTKRRPFRQKGQSLTVFCSTSLHTSRCILKFLKFLTSMEQDSHLKALLTLWILRCMVADELCRNRSGQIPQPNSRSFVWSPIWFLSPRRVKNVCGQWSQLYFRICVWHSMWLLRSNFLRNSLRQNSQENFIGSVLWTSWCLYSKAEFLKDDGQSVHTKALEKKREKEWNEKSDRMKLWWT